MSFDQSRALRRTIKASGLSARKWAREVAKVDERTVRRWLSGESEMSPYLRHTLLRPTAPTRTGGR